MPTRRDVDLDFENTMGASQGQDPIDLDARVAQLLSDLTLGETGLVEHCGTNTEAKIGLRNPRRCPQRRCVNICSHTVHVIKLAIVLSRYKWEIAQDDDETLGQSDIGVARRGR